MGYNSRLFKDTARDALREVHDLGAVVARLVFVALQEQNKAIEENKIKNKEMSFGSAKR
jgi:hypothetical protein